MSAVKGLALLLTGTVAVGGGLAYMGGDTTVTVNCGPQIDRPAVSTAFTAIDKVTGSFNAVASGKVGANEVAAAWFDTRAMGELLADYTVAKGRGQDLAGADRIKADIEAGVEAGAAACCPPTVEPPRVAPGVTPDLASVSGGAVAAASGQVPVDGPDLAAAALRAAAPDDAKWLSQIPLGVAIAKEESSFKHGAANYVLGGHVGYWQISGPNAAHLKLGDRTDVYANAKYAYALWKGRGGTWAKDWTTYKTALGHVDEYARYSSGAPAASLAAPETTTVAPAGAGCVGAPTVASGAQPNVRVVTFNQFHGSKWPSESRGNDQRVVKAMLFLAKDNDIIGVQEASERSRKAKVNAAMARIGWGVTGEQTSHPIYFRKATMGAKPIHEVAIRWFQRGEPMEGPDQGIRYVVGAQFRTKSGAVEGYVNMHQLPHIADGDHLDPDQPKRSKIAMRGWNTLGKVVRSFAPAGPVTVTGDMNFKGGAPAGVLEGMGLTTVTQVLGPVGERNDRDIDIIASTGVPDTQKDMGQFGSDHSARRAVYLAVRQDQAPSAATGQTIPGLSAGAAGIKAIAKANGATANPHRDPAGKPSFDIMSTGAKRDKIAAEILANHEALGVDYVIANMKIVSANSNPAWTWRTYKPITGSGDFRHVNHVHVTYHGGS